MNRPKKVNLEQCCSK